MEKTSEIPESHYVRVALKITKTFIQHWENCRKVSLIKFENKKCRNSEKKFQNSQTSSKSRKIVVYLSSLIPKRFEDFSGPKNLIVCKNKKSLKVYPYI